MHDCVMKGCRQNLMAFASKNIGYGDGERRNYLDTVRKNKKDNNPTTKPFTT